jgi:hypothetical protein
MTTYKGINGFAVQSVASDPSPSNEGQVWYNNATYAFKLASVTTSGTWATGGNLGTPRYSSGAAGIQTAALLIAGQNSVPNLSTSAVESYNGSSWASSPSYPAIYFGLGGAGTQTAAVAWCGSIPSNYGPGVATWHNDTNKWNGSAWTSSGAYPRAQSSQGAAGTQTAALSTGGTNTAPGAPGLTTATNTYNGTSWTTVPATLVTAYGFPNSMFGTQTSALAITGNTPNSVQSYNGTTWTAGTSMNTTRYASAFGDSNQSGVAFGGPPNVSSTEVWNGTSWTNNPTGLNTGRSSAVGFGTTSAGLAAGASSGSVPTDQATEAWTGPGVPQTKTITTS